METRLLTRWASNLAAHHQLLPHTLEALPIADVCAAIGAMQYQLALDTARYAYSLPAGNDRDAERRKLRSSDNPLDRLAAQIADRWDAADRQRSGSS